MRGEYRMDERRASASTRIVTALAVIAVDAGAWIMAWAIWLAARGL